MDIVSTLAYTGTHHVAGNPVHSNTGVTGHHGTHNHDSSVETAAYNAAHPNSYGNTTHSTQSTTHSTNPISKIKDAVTGKSHKTTY